MTEKIEMIERIEKMEKIGKMVWMLLRMRDEVGRGCA